MSAIASQRAEESVLAFLLTGDTARIEVIGQGLEPEHFHYRPYRTLYEQVVERFYADEPIDPLVVAEAVGPRLAKQWQIDERQVVDKVRELAVRVDGDAKAHAAVVKEHADRRALIAIAHEILLEAQREERNAEAIAGAAGAELTRLVQSAMRHNELVGYADAGRRWWQHARIELQARIDGVELGAYFGIRAIDERINGLRPTELMILGGDPGVGKSAIAWTMARNFALRQLDKPPDRRVGALVLSLEMGEELSSNRFAQMESGVEGERLRAARVTEPELFEIARQWAAHRELPLWQNFSGELRESQLKAIVMDAIRRYNVGLVIVDHFRFIKTDERFDNKNDADEQIVKFLKASLAKDLNLAVVCLAHTTKSDGSKPRMDDLRGSKMISAFADVVVFPWHPWGAASERERESMDRFRYELLFAKVRQGQPGMTELHIDMSRMAVL